MDADGLRTWVETIRGARRALMHRATGRFGAVVEFYDGVEKVYRSTEDGSLTEGPVVELSSGDAFHVYADEDGFGPEMTFRALTVAETRFWSLTMSAIAAAVGEIAAAGAANKIPEDIGPAMIAAALRHQATAIAGPIGDEAVL